MGYVVETSKLTKYYGKSRGIIDVDITIEKGEIFGFIGPNGAGKSTTIRTLLALIHKTSGQARIFGLDCEKDHKRIMEKVGYLPSEVFYYDNMKAADLLRYSASFYRTDCSGKIKYLSDALELDLNKKIEDMSLGNKKKVGIIQGLLHSPELIILDEPTSGLDPLMQRTFFSLIQEERNNGATVLFSSHILSEVQRICDRVAIIRDGRIIKTQRIYDLQKDAYKKVSFTVASGVPVCPVLEGIVGFEIHGKTAGFLFKGNCNFLLTEISRQDIADIDISDPPLEDVFMHYYTSSEEGSA
ncbi:MAG: ABC transporter ATP-binding protein [Clostridiales bacterium]|nr:ABC transporter ATP-binding protein [Clostridiales bacterium]